MNCVFGPVHHGLRVSSLPSQHASWALKVVRNLKGWVFPNSNHLTISVTEPEED